LSGRGNVLLFSSGLTKPMSELQGCRTPICFRSPKLLAVMRTSHLTPMWREYYIPTCYPIVAFGHTTFSLLLTFSGFDTAKPMYTGQYTKITPWSYSLRYYPSPPRSWTGSEVWVSAGFQKNPSPRGSVIGSGVRTPPRMLVWSRVRVSVSFQVFSSGIISGGISPWGTIS